MKITSLARQTDLIFAEFSSEIFDRGHYTAIRTPTNMDYHWGNLLIFEQPPQKGSMQTWIDTFNREFPYYDNDSNHFLFTWNPELTPKDDVLTEFLDFGFALDRGVVLQTGVLHPPRYFNSSIEIRPYKSPDDWNNALTFCLKNRDAVYEKQSFDRFKRSQFSLYQQMSAVGQGNRFGAYLDGEIVGDLGLFHKNGLGRYQNVMTHPSHLRQGICSTLVFQAGMHAIKEWQVNSLVMEADADYHAARIYQSVGFKPVEQNLALHWKRPANK